MKKKIFAAVLTAVLATGVLAGCTESTDGNTTTGGTTGTTANNTAPVTVTEDGQELQTLRVAVMTGQPDQYIAEIGLQQGIFEKYGINLEVTEYIYGIATIDAIVNGTADIGEMADYAAVNRLGNTYGVTDLVLFSELTGSSERIGGLYVAPGYADDLSSLDGSIGFMSTTGTVLDYYTAKAIEWLGFDYDKQNIIAVDSNQTALALAQSNSASAYIVGGATATYFEEYGWELVASYDELGIETGSYMLANRSYVDANADLLANYILAFEEVEQYITDNLDESAVYLVEKLGVVEEDFKQNWNNFVIRPGFTEEAAAHLNDVRAWAYGAGRFEAEYDIKEFIDTTVVEKAVPDKVTVVFQ